MFLDSLKETEAVLYRYKSQQEAIKDEGTLSNNLAIINGAVQEITGQMAASAEAKKELVPGAGMDQTQREELYGRLHQLKEDLEDGIDVTEGSKALRSSAKLFIDGEDKKWKQAVEEKANSQISLLQQLKDFTDDTNAASSIVTQLKYNISQMPKNPQAVQTFGKTLHNAENIVQKIGGTPVVMEFINKVTNGQANISDLNDDIWSWIRSHDMEKRLKIRL